MVPKAKLMSKCILKTSSFSTFFSTTLFFNSTISRYPVATVNWYHDFISDDGVLIIPGLYQIYPTKIYLVRYNTRILLLLRYNNNQTYQT